MYIYVYILYTYSTIYISTCAQSNIYVKIACNYKRLETIQCQFKRKWLHKLCLICLGNTMQLKKEGKSSHEIIIMKTYPGHTDKVQNSLRKWENENIYLYLLYLHKEALLNTQETHKSGSL